MAKSKKRKFYTDEDSPKAAKASPGHNSGEVILPNNWEPRPDQLPLWTYLETGGLRGVEIAHRRWGKDDVALHWTALAANDVGYEGCLGRIGNYWHMLPKAAQARKAIWDAINPMTGKKSH
jgi:phage terminase large subunit